MSPHTIAVIGGLLAGIGLSGLLIRLLARYFVTTSLSIVLIAGVLLLGYSAVLYTKQVIDTKVAEVTNAFTAPQKQVSDVVDKATGAASGTVDHVRSILGK